MKTNKNFHKWNILGSSGASLAHATVVDSMNAVVAGKTYIINGEQVEEIENGQ